MKKSKIIPHSPVVWIIITLFCILIVVLIKFLPTIGQISPLCKRCNIVLIILDPLRADELPCYGYSKNTTPNLCAFANRNSVYTQMYSQSSWTLPSVMSLLSSQYPSRHNMFIPIVDVLAANTITLPMALQKAGYHTVFIGPTTTSDTSHHVPLDRGVERGFDTLQEYTSLSEAAKSVQTIMADSLNEKPVFILIHSFDLRNNSIKTAPDTFPLDPTYRYGFVDPYLRTISLETNETAANITSYRRIYDERLRNLDAQFYSFMQTIQNSPMQERTIVAITSDHGDEFGEHGQSSHGLNLFATTTHVPFILRIPKIKPQLNSNLIQSIDIYPSLLEAVGIRVPSTTQGRNVFSKPNGYKQQSAVAISQLEPEKHLSAIRNSHWSYYFNPDTIETQRNGKLYNRIRDPKELYDMADTNSHVISTLLMIYHQNISQ